MAGDKSEAINKRAYELWESEGRPEGRHHDHWRQAEQEHEGMMGDGTEEQNLDQPGNPSARITEAEVKAAFQQSPPSASTAPTSASTTSAKKA